MQIKLVATQRVDYKEEIIVQEFTVHISRSNLKKMLFCSFLSRMDKLTVKPTNVSSLNNAPLIHLNVTLWKTATLSIYPPFFFFLDMHTEFHLSI